MQPPRLLAGLALFAAVACNGDEPDIAISPIPSGLHEFDLTSPAFDEGGPIPERYTCDGEDVSPPLEWTGVPEGTAELVLTFLDPDVPSGVFTHWTIHSIDPSAPGTPEGGVPEGAVQGLNDFGDTGYGGPCPPPGPAHRYVFTLGALAEPSGLSPGAAPSAVDPSLQQATATTTLTGFYPG
jgi:hypothetical protein